MIELRYHWTNPKFAGLPWSCDDRIRRSKKECVWKSYSLADAREETARLRVESPGSTWKFKRCGMCKSFHIVRR